MPSSAAPAACSLGDAEAQLRAGELEAVRRQLAAILPTDSVDAIRLFAAARLYPEALAALDAALAQPSSRGTRTRLLTLQVALELRLGQPHRALAALDELLPLEATNRRFSHWVIDTLVELQRTKEALEVWERLTRAGAPDSGLLTRGANLHRLLGQPEKAVGLLREAVETGEPTTQLSLDVATALLALADLDGARRSIDRILRDEPTHPRALALRTRLLLWQGEYEEALLVTGDGLELRRERAGAILLLGQPAQALAELEPVLQRRPDDVEVLVWRAEALLRLGRFGEAEEAAGVAVRTNDVDHFPARLIAQLAKLAHRSTWVTQIFQEGPSLRPADWMRMARKRVHRRGSLVPLGLRDLELQQLAQYDDAPDLADAHDRGEWIAILERILARLRGNRSVHTVLVEGPEAAPRGRLLVLCKDIRARCLEVVKRLEALGDEAALRRLRKLHDEHPDSPYPFTYGGEIDLWHGRYAAARRQFFLALQTVPFTRWAYIGLSAVATLEGDHRQALWWGTLGVKLCGAPGPTYWVYRGEALRRLHRHAEARATLQRACEVNPSRVSAWINLALLHAELGEAAAYERAVMRVERLTPGLVLDATRETGTALWTAATGYELQRGARVLEHMLTMMRGNRSSATVSYFLRDGQMRFLPFIHTEPTDGASTRGERAFLDLPSVWG